MEARFLLAVLFHYFNNEKANKAAFSTILLPKNIVLVKLRTSLRCSLYRKRITLDRRKISM